MLLRSFLVVVWASSALASYMLIKIDDEDTSGPGWKGEVRIRLKLELSGVLASTGAICT